MQQKLLQPLASKEMTRRVTTRKTAEMKPTTARGATTRLRRTGTIRFLEWGSLSRPPKGVRPQPPAPGSKGVYYQHGGSRRTDICWSTPASEGALRGDSTIVLAAVRQNVRAVQHTDERHRSDPEVGPFFEEYARLTERNEFG